MKLFHMGVRAEADTSCLRATTWAGDLLIEAKDEKWARLLASLNFSIATERDPIKHRVIPNLWGDHTASFCAECDCDERHKLAPSYIVAGADISEQMIDEPELVMDGEVVARMHWWPCSASDKCPA
jgi:hypothetical protein